MDRQMNAVLEDIKAQILQDRTDALDEQEHHRMDSAPGTGMAHNVPEVLDSFERYLADIVDTIEVRADVPEGAAMAVLKGAVNELVDMGEIPPIPAEGDVDGMALWLGKAKSVGLGGYAMKAAYDQYGS